MSDLIERLRAHKNRGYRVQTNLNWDAADEIERLQQKVHDMAVGKLAGALRDLPKFKRLTEELNDAKGTNQHYKVDCDKLQARVETLEGAASYLSAEVKDAWDQGRISVDTFHAALAMDTALAATEQGDSDVLPR